MTIVIEEVFNLSHLQLRLVSLWVNHAAHPLVSIKTLRRVELGTLWDLAHTWMGFCWQSWHMFRISLQINLMFNVILWYYIILYDTEYYMILNIIWYWILYDTEFMLQTLSQEQISCSSFFCDYGVSACKVNCWWWRGWRWVSETTQIVGHPPTLPIWEESCIPS